MTAPKAISKPASTKAKAAKPEVSLEEAAKLRERKSRLIKRKQQDLKDGDTGLVLVPFYYADGRTVAIRVSAFSQRVMNIDQQKNGTVATDAGGGVIGFSVRAVKKIKVSFGRARKKIKDKDGKVKDRLVQAWKELSIPADANKLDAIHWVKSFNKKAGGIRIGTETIVLDSRIMRSAAGGVK
jgi:hypothetical protein